MRNEQRLPEKILKLAASLPEGTPLTAKELLHLGSRAAVDQALSRLFRQGQLMRTGRGLYVRPVEGRFGPRPPATSKIVEALAAKLGEVVVPQGAAAANSLGLTTQVPIREVYWTSGRSRQLKVGAQTIELRHASPWQLILPRSLAGNAVRALGWLGRNQTSGSFEKIAARLSNAERKAIVESRPLLPTWLAQKVSSLALDA